ncbi:Protein S100-A1 S-100 protein alpha chain S-100 protein subunit alpha [Channa argus]|uniref:Protein S100 n=2 Tax=Channa TaxID=33789 RepID=A0A6G1QHP5_CHAAH|nr:Protein S100-A1 S-100 protein alpha chain S-100 protein subunit alpha [Channa argus]
MPKPQAQCFLRDLDINSNPEENVTNKLNELHQCRPSPLDTIMPSQLEGAMDALIAVFYNYSGNDGDKYKLNKGELKQLLNCELTDFLTSQKDPMLVEKIMNDLDSNKDNEVDFNEFVVLVAALTVACNDFFQEQKKKSK